MVRTSLGDRLLVISGHKHSLTFITGGYAKPATQRGLAARQAATSRGGAMTLWDFLTVISSVVPISVAIESANHVHAGFLYKEHFPIGQAVDGEIF
jgi:hypothetical protein